MSPRSSIHRKKAFAHPVPASGGVTFTQVADCRRTGGRLISRPAGKGAVPDTSGAVPFFDGSNTSAQPESVEGHPLTFAQSDYASRPAVAALPSTSSG